MSKKIYLYTEYNFPGHSTYVYGDADQKPTWFDRLLFWLNLNSDDFCYTQGEMWWNLPSGWINEKHLPKRDL